MRVSNNNYINQELDLIPFALPNRYNVNTQRNTAYFRHLFPFDDNKLYKNGIFHLKKKNQEEQTRQRMKGRKK